LNAFQTLFDKWADTADFSSGSVISSEEAPASVVFVVLSGEIELSLRGVSLGRVGAGGIIGEMAMIGSTTGSPTAKAATDVKLARLDRDQFNRMIANHPEFSLHALSAMASRLRAMNSFVEAQLGSRE